MPCDSMLSHYRIVGHATFCLVIAAGQRDLEQITRRLTARIGIAFEAWSLGK